MIPKPLPNAFELYGVDFLVSHALHDHGGARFQVQLLEINSEPAIELTGPRLTWILEGLFNAIKTVCVEPFLRPSTDERSTWEVGQVRHELCKCLDVRVHGVDGK